MGVKVFNMLPSYIQTEFDNPKKFKVVLQKVYVKILFIPWMNILNFKKVKYSHMIWIDIYMKVSTHVPSHLSICIIFFSIYN